MHGEIQGATGNLRTLLLMLAAAASAGAMAQTSYPTRPVRVVVVNPAGSGADIVARLVSPKLSEAMGQQFVVDNRGGSSGILASELVVKAQPDGYTLLLGSSSSQTIIPSVFTSLPYDPVRDLAPITMLASTPYLMVAHPAMPAKSVSEVIALAKAKPGQLNYGTGGIAVGSTLAGELFKSMAGVNIVMVPYKGAPQATADVVAGQVQLAFSTLPTGFPLVKAGKLRALGVTAAKRVSVAPDVPTIAESGLPGYEVQTWFGLLAPRAVSAPILQRLNGEANRSIGQADVRDRLHALGYDPVGTSPGQFAELIQSEIAKWTKLVQIAGIPRQSAGQ